MSKNWMTMLSAVSQDEHRIVFRTYTGAVIAVDDPPHGESINRPAEIVAGLLRGLGEFDEAQRKADKDETLSQLGKERALAPRRDNLRRLITTATGEAEGFAASVANMERAVLEPPMLDKDDVVGALRDNEIRNYLRALGGKQRSEALEQMCHSPALLEAVMRSPVPMGHFSEAAVKIWPEHVLATRPEAEPVIRHQQARDWAKASLGVITAAADQAINKSEPSKTRP